MGTRLESRRDVDGRGMRETAMSATKSIGSARHAVDAALMRFSGLEGLEYLKLRGRHGFYCLRLHRDALERWRNANAWDPGGYGPGVHSQVCLCWATFHHRRDDDDVDVWILDDRNRFVEVFQPIGRISWVTWSSCNMGKSNLGGVCGLTLFVSFGNDG